MGDLKVLQTQRAHNQHLIDKNKIVIQIGAICELGDKMQQRVQQAVAMHDEQLMEQLLVVQEIVLIVIQIINQVV